MCKHSDMFSLAVLIGRGLDLSFFWFFSLFGFEGTLQKSKKDLFLLFFMQTLSIYFFVDIMILYIDDLPKPSFNV